MISRVTSCLPSLIVGNRGSGLSEGPSAAATVAAPVPKQAASPAACCKNARRVVDDPHGAVVGSSEVDMVHSPGRRLDSRKGGHEYITGRTRQPVVEALPQFSRDAESSKRSARARLWVACAGTPVAE